MKNKTFSIDRIILYIFLTVIILYFCQGSLYANGSPVSQASLVLWITISLTYAYKYFSKFKATSFERLIFFFWLINSIYWLFSEKAIVSEWHESLSTMNNFKSICCTFLTYFPIRYMTKKGILTEKLFIIFTIVLLATFILSFFNFQARLLALYNREAITNNMGYRFVALLPLLGFIRKPKYAFPLLIITIYFIIMSSKRGAIVCGIVSFLLYFYYTFKSVPKNKKVQYSIVILGLFIVFVYMSYDMLMSNEYLMNRLSNMEAGNDDSGNARISQVSAIWDYSLNGSIFHFLFGYGFDKSVMIAGNYAHNDWAELLANLGIFGCIIYLIFFIKLFNIFKRNKKYLTQDECYIIVSTICIWFTITLFSMGYISNNSFLLIIAIAYINTKIEKVKYHV